MNAFGRIASFFHSKRPQERKMTLNINLDMEGNGAGKMIPVDFMVDRRGRARLMTDNELPKELQKKYDDTLLAAVVAITGWKVVKTEQGLRLSGPDGIVQYEFVIALQDGTTGIPYRVKPLSGKREYGDLRNYILSSYLEGATIDIKINSVNCDLKNSELKEITRKVRHFEIYNLDGSETVVYKTEAHPTLEKALYREYEAYKKIFIVKHILPQKPAGSFSVSYPDFGPSERQSWLPSVPSQASTEEGEERKVAPIRHAERVFGNGFEVIVDFMPKLHENSQPQLAEFQILADAIEVGDEKCAMASENEGIAQVVEWQHVSVAALPAKVQESGSMPSKTKEKIKIQGNDHRNEIAKLGTSISENIGGQQKGARKKAHSKPVPFSALKNFKAVIFDLDGVIVDSEMVHPRTFEMALAKYGIRIDNAHWKRAYTGIGSYAIFDDIVKKYKLKEDARELVKKRNGIYMKEIRKNRLPMIAGFAEIHKLLLENGVKEAVASGGHINHVEESMRSAGLTNVPFVAIEQVKKGKPAPEIFLKAAKRIRVKPSECVVFEDSLSGIEAAARAGMPCVALSTTMKARELSGRAALVIRDYRSKKLKRLLAILLGKRNNDAKKAPNRGRKKRRKSGR